LTEQEFKYQSGVRLLCKWRSQWGLAKFREYLSKYQIDSNLLQGYADQYGKKNRGNWGEWR